MRLRFVPLMIAAVLLVSAYTTLAYAQAGHLGHHPAPGGAAMPAAGDQAPPASPDAAAMPTGGGQMTPGGQPVPSAAGGGMAVGTLGAAPAGGMGAEMGEMMKQMGAPPAKELYPTLMALPNGVTPEERAKIEQLARERM